MSDHILMRFVIQRVKEAEVVVSGKSQGKLKSGFMILFGLSAPSELKEYNFLQDKKLLDSLDKCIHKIIGLRVFNDEEGKMNKSLVQSAEGIYLVSQFTLFADCKKGFRPSFVHAAKLPFAADFYKFVENKWKEACSQADLKFYSGEFGADMQVSFMNEGPVTIILDADRNGIVKV